MRPLIESLRRLSKAGKVRKEKLAGMMEVGTIIKAKLEHITVE